MPIIREIHIPNLDGVGGTIHVSHDPQTGGTFHGVHGVVWDVDRSDPPPDLAENIRRGQVIEAAAAAYVDQAGNLPTRYDAAAPDHLRIYGLDRIPDNLVGVHLAHRPPTDFDFGLLKLQKESVLSVDDHGDIPLMLYSDNGVEVCRRVFQFAYAVDANGATELTVTETPGWARNDGTWVDGVSRSETYRGARYNAWRDSARQRIFEALKTWLPLVLKALGEVADVPAGEALSGGWLAANHGAEWSHYLASGRKEAISDSLSLANDPTAWLDSVVPDGVVPGLTSGQTVRQMILAALR